MDRRTFMGVSAAAGAAECDPCSPRAAQPQRPPKADNVVLVHGLFADGSCWSEVIARLQAAGHNATSVQNPLTTLEESVAAAQRALALQDGPTVLVGHSFSGMIVTEAGSIRRSPHWSMSPRGLPMPARTTQPWPRNSRHRRPRRASSGPAITGSSARRHSCAISPATCRRRKRACSTRCRGRSIAHCSPARQPMRPGDRNRAGTPCPRRTGRSIRI